MELLLLAACAWLAYQGGAQSEQAKLGVSPAQRDIMREEARHEKAVRRIAEKHGTAAAPTTARTGTAGSQTDGVPETFLSGYRSSRPDHPPLSHRAGQWAGRGVGWGQGVGRDAWRKYRKRRKDAGHDDPGPVLVPLPPARPPDVPPVPASPPTAGLEKDTDGAADSAPPAIIPAEVPPKPAEAPKKAPVGSVKKPPELTADEDPDFDLDEPLEPVPENTGERPEPHTADPAPPPDAGADTPQADTTPPADTTQGVGRMAAEVTYESVEEETDDLSAMCEEDVRVYDRIRSRSEREVTRGDELAMRLKAAGFGSSVIAWVIRCKEQYQVIRDQVDDLQRNTLAQGEKVVEAKALLVAGQGVYADIAKDMEDVAERDSYISDAVDAEDTNPEAEHYETKAA